MIKVDSHVHVWTHHPEYAWTHADPDLPSYDAHPETLLAAMATEGVAAAVLVQYIGYRWNNRYVAHVLRTFPDKFMGVCRVDPEDPVAPEHLWNWTKLHGFHGVRISPEPDARGDWFRSPLMIPFFRSAADLQVPVLVLTKPSRLPELLAILEAVPDVDVVVDHMADCRAEDPTHRQLLATLADHPRVFMKTGHVWANASTDYPWRDQHPLLELVCELYGVDRVMWGSDWSFCLRRATYGQALAYLRDEAPFLAVDDLAWVLGRTALRLWPFSPHTLTGVTPSAEDVQRSDTQE